jgi:hypothetical protein
MAPDACDRVYEIRCGSMLGEHMGLDAGVYKNLQNVSGSLRELVRLVDAKTGAIDFEDGVWPAGYDRKDLFAIEIRIGNLSTVVELRGEVGDRLPGKSLLLDAVLYHFSHTVDFIPLSQLDELEREVKFIRATPDPLRSDLQAFLNKMTMLTDTARKEDNPIVFI